MKLPIAFVFFQWKIKTALFADREKGKDQESIKKSTIPDQEHSPYSNVKKTQYVLRYKKAKKSAYFQKVITKQYYKDKHET